MTFTECPAETHEPALDITGIHDELAVTSMGSLNRQTISRFRKVALVAPRLASQVTRSYSTSVGRERMPPNLIASLQ
jgi:hypothetical protein